MWPFVCGRECGRGLSVSVSGVLLYFLFVCVGVHISMGVALLWGRECGPIVCGRERGRSPNVCGHEWGRSVAPF